MIYFPEIQMKGDDDLRQDAVMEQIFELVNNFLRQDVETRRRKLHVRTYKVIPLPNMNGLLEFVANTTPLGTSLLHLYELVINLPPLVLCRNSHADWSSPSVQRDLPSESGAGRPNRVASDRNETSRHGHQEAAEALNVQQVVAEDAACHAPPLLETTKGTFALVRDATQLLEECRNNLYDRSRSRTRRSTRFQHPHRRSDRRTRSHRFRYRIRTSKFSLCPSRSKSRSPRSRLLYQQGKRLPIPELIPFRLTHNIIDGFGSSGYEGVFRRSSEETLRVLRDRSNILMTILEVFKHDPLQRW
jgi:ataxia telangiectasia mutated family protein